MPNYPCRYCVPPKRHPACHDTCKEFRDAKALEQERKNAERGRKEATQYTMENMMKTNNFNVKKKREGRLTYSKKG